MRIPEKPKSLQKLLSEFSKKENFLKLISENIVDDGASNYYHWDKIRYKKFVGYTPEEIWLNIKLKRSMNYKKIQLETIGSDNFVFSTPDVIQKELSHLDKECSVQTSKNLEDSHIPKNYFFRSLFEEAISSSQLEGAATTRKVAKKMLEKQRKPRNKDEQMIFNNYNAMMFIKENKNEDLSPTLILDLHKIISKDTLSDSKCEGNLRDNNEITVQDLEGNILFTPPDYSKLKNLINDLCSFANDKVFIHPILKGIILHFYLAYLHPFEDGNGRTARALFYWYMAKTNYWLLEYVSISSVIKNAPVQYAKSYLHTETDDNDLTYFCLHQLNTIVKAIDRLHNYLNNKVKNISSAIELIKNNDKLKKELNSRQLALIKHASKHPNFVYNVKTHENYHLVTNQTARNDLVELSDKFKLLKKVKSGRSYLFISPDDINEFL